MGSLPGIFFRDGEFKNEPFLENVDFLSDLKLRFSWGRNGNSAIPSGYLQSSYVADYNGTSYAMNGQESGSLQSGFRKYLTGNSTLKWETVTQTNYGIDFRFFNQSLVGTIDYFYRRQPICFICPLISVHSVKVEILM